MALVKNSLQLWSPGQNPGNKVGQHPIGGTNWIQWVIHTYTYKHTYIYIHTCTQTLTYIYIIYIYT